MKRALIALSLTCIALALAMVPVPHDSTATPWSLVAQTAPEGVTVNLTGGPTNRAFQQVFAYDGSGNLQYVGYALSINSQSTLPTVSAATLANPAVLTSTAHGIDSTTNAEVTITGGTGDYDAFNGTWPVTVTSANAFSIPVDSSAFAVFGAQAITVTTTAPRTNQPVWAIHRFTYTGTSVTGSHWAKMVGSPPSAMNKKWSLRATLGAAGVGSYQ